MRSRSVLPSLSSIRLIALAAVASAVAGTIGILALDSADARVAFAVALLSSLLLAVAAILTSAYRQRLIYQTVGITYDIDAFTRQMGLVADERVQEWLSGLENLIREDPQLVPQSQPWFSLLQWQIRTEGGDSETPAIALGQTLFVKARYAEALLVRLDALDEAADVRSRIDALLNVAPWVGWHERDRSHNAPYMP